MSNEQDKIMVSAVENAENRIYKLAQEQGTDIYDASIMSEALLAAEFELLVLKDKYLNALAER